MYLLKISDGSEVIKARQMYTYYFHRNHIKIAFEYFNLLWEISVKTPQGQSWSSHDSLEQMAFNSICFDDVIYYKKFFLVVNSVKPHT